MQELSKAEAARLNMSQSLMSATEARLFCIPACSHLERRQDSKSPLLIVKSQGGSPQEEADVSAEDRVTID